MKILVAVVCEHAWVENGCLSVSKAFDAISAGPFPYTMPRLTIALRLLVRRSETGDHKLRFSLADSDGKKLMNSDFNINVQLLEESVPESSFSFALNGQNVVFPGAGDYAVDIVIDGRVEACIPIYVREARK